VSCAEEFVWVPSAGVKLAGVLHLPPSGRARPVILLHGFTGSKSEAGRLYTDLARVLCGAGYAVLRFDYRGHGDSPLPFEEFSIPKAVEDAQSAIEYVKGLGGVDASRLALVGLSMGGGVAVKVAAGRDDVAALVLLAPALDWPELTKRAPFRAEGGYVYMGALRLRAEHALESSRFTVMDLAERVRAPTLIVHAVDDEVVPIDQSRRFYERLRVPKRLVEVRGGHVFNDYWVRRQIEGEILSWIRQYL